MTIQAEANRASGMRQPPPGSVRPRAAHEPKGAGGKQPKGAGGKQPKGAGGKKR